MNIKEQIEINVKCFSYVNISITDNIIRLRFSQNIKKLLDLPFGYTYECDGFVNFNYDDVNDMFSFIYTKNDSLYVNGDNKFDSVESLKTYYLDKNLEDNLDPYIQSCKTKFLKRNRYYLERGLYPMTTQIEGLQQYVVFRPVILIIF